MVYLYFLVSCIAFIELFIALDLKREAARLIKRSRDALAVVTSVDLEDDEKEAFMRRASLEMFKVTFQLFAKFLLIILVLYVVYWLTLVAFPELGAPILQGFVSPIVIVGLTFMAIFYVWVRNVILK